MIVVDDVRSEILILMSPSVVEVCSELLSLQLNVSFINLQNRTPSSERKFLVKSPHTRIGESYNFISFVKRNRPFTLIEYGNR